MVSPYPNIRRSKRLLLLLRRPSGNPLTIPKAVKRRWQRPPSVPPRKGNVAGCGWWCAAPVSRIPPRRNCGPTGDTTRSLPTPNNRPYKPMPITGPMPEQNWLYGTSNSTLSPVWELLRQRRLAFLRHPCSQPLPMDRTPGRTTNQRQHRPHPTVHTARKDRKPRTKTDPAPSHPMAMGQHLPHRELLRRRPQPTATLLTPAHSPPNKPSANVSHRFRTSPHAPDPTEHPNKPAEPRQNLTHPHKTTPRHTPQPQKRPHHPDRTPRSVDSG